MGTEKILRVLGTEGRHIPKRCEDGHLQINASISASGMLIHMCINTVLHSFSAVTEKRKYEAII